MVTLVFVGIDEAGAMNWEFTETPQVPFCSARVAMGMYAAVPCRSVPAVFAFATSRRPADKPDVGAAVAFPADDGAEVDDPADLPTGGETAADGAAELVAGEDGAADGAAELVAGEDGAGDGAPDVVTGVGGGAAAAGPATPIDTMTANPTQISALGPRTFSLRTG